MDSSIIAPFLSWAARSPDAAALRIDGQQWSYAQLLAHAEAIAGGFAEQGAVAILASRSVSAYAGVIASLLAGRTYVPLNPAFPVERLAWQVQFAKCTTLVTGEEGAAALTLLEHLDEQPVVIEGHSPQKAPLFQASPVADGLAYVLFTSGSTGLPKAVGITHANVAHMVRASQERYQVRPEDRLSQTFDLVFDLSVFDMFMAWSHGACLTVPTAGDLFAPRDWIRREAITVWFSVPSLGRHMMATRQLEPDGLPTLRWSLFCGEALEQETAQTWALAASNSHVENLYGPTELTVYTTVYRYEQGPAFAYVNGVVHIGQPIGEMVALVVDQQGNQVPVGEAGELVMSGPQQAPGYLRDPDRSAQSFVSIPGQPGTWYHTGDRVRRPAVGEPLVYLGRLDRQVQVRGHRVELGEVEHRLGALTDARVAVVALPHRAPAADRLIAFVGDDVDTKALKRGAKEVLPPYMRPARIKTLDALPLNANGKIDYNALSEMA